MRYFVVFQDDDKGDSEARGFKSESLADAFRQGIDYVNDSAIEVVGIFTAKNAAEAIKRAADHLADELKD